MREGDRPQLRGGVKHQHPVLAIRSVHLNEGEEQVNPRARGAANCEKRVRLALEPNSLPMRVSWCTAPPLTWITLPRSTRTGKIFSRPCQSRESSMSSRQRRPANLHSPCTRSRCLPLLYISCTVRNSSFTYCTSRVRVPINAHSCFISKPILGLRSGNKTNEK